MPPEECDDGNNADGDGCSSVCTIEHGAAESSRAPTLPNCGNGIPEVGEECDDGNTIDGDGCSAFCLREVLFVSSSFATSSFSVVQSSAASLIPVFSAFSSSSSVFFIPPVVTEQAAGIGLGWILLLLTIILALCVPVVVLFLKLRRKSDT
jgi:cysteine-rich repeat protein